MPAILREVVLRPRHVMNCSACRNAIKTGGDASDALAALFATGGTLQFPDQGEAVILTKRITATANGLWLRGGASHANGTIIRLDAANAGINFQATTESGLSGMLFKGSVTVLPTAGAAVATTKNGGSNTYGFFANNLRFERCYDGIDIYGATNSRLESKIEMREPHGTFGVRMYGASLADRADKLRIENLICDTPYPYAAYASSWKGAMGRSTAYLQGDVATSGGNIYQCTVAGTTAAGAAPTGKGTTGSRLITDGGVTWQFICSLSLKWVLQDSYAYSLDVFDSALINGAYGFYAADSVNSGSSYPTWHYFVDTDFDHNAISGVVCAAGEDFRGLAVWVSSSLSLNGVYFDSAYRGEGGLFNSQIRGNAQHGVLHDGGRGLCFSGCDYVDNGQAANNTYSNHAVGAGVSGFQIVNNRFLPITGQLAQKAKYPVIINSGVSDGYVITGNLTKGHGTAGTIQDGGSGANKVVTNNYGF